MTLADLPTGLIIIRYGSGYKSGGGRKCGDLCPGLINRNGTKSTIAVINKLRSYTEVSKTSLVCKSVSHSVPAIFAARAYGLVCQSLLKDI